MLSPSQVVMMAMMVAIMSVLVTVVLFAVCVVLCSLSRNNLAKTLNAQIAELRGMMTVTVGSISNSKGLAIGSENEAFVNSGD